MPMERPKRPTHRNKQISGEYDDATFALTSCGDESTGYPQTPPSICNDDSRDRSTLTHSSEQGQPDGHGRRKRNRLPDQFVDKTISLNSLVKVEEYQQDTSSCSSKDSPRDDLGEVEGVRYESRQSSYSSPAEVVVKGDNVRKIKVRFSPAPPLETHQKLFQHQTLLRRRVTDSATRFKVRRQEPQEHEDEAQTDDESKPGQDHSHLSLERESDGLKYKLKSMTQKYNSSLDDHTYQLTNKLITKETDTTQSSRKLLSEDSPTIDLSQQHCGKDTAVPQDIRKDSGRGSNYMMRVKHDIINGLEYFQRKVEELQMVIEQESEINGKLRKSIELIEKEKAELCHENHELKVKLDESEREINTTKSKLKSQWHEKVHLEEHLVKLQAETNETIHGLKYALDLKNQEIAQLNSTMKLKTQQNMLHKKVTTPKRPPIAEEHWDSLQKITRLEDDIEKLKCEKLRNSESEKRHKDDLDKVRTELRDTSAKLERQYTSFLSLKKSFNDIKEENDKLRSQLQTARVKSLSSVSSSKPGNTWPKNVQPPMLLQTSLRQRVSDGGPPPQLLHSLPVVRPTMKVNTVKVGPLAIEHVRTAAKAECKPSTDSLPPV